MNATGAYGYIAAAVMASALVLSATQSADARTTKPRTSEHKFGEPQALMFATVTNITPIAKLDSNDDDLYELISVEFDEINLINNRVFSSPISSINVAGRVYCPNDSNCFVRTGHDTLVKGNRYLISLKSGEWLENSFTDSPYIVENGVIRCGKDGRVFGIGPTGFLCDTGAGSEMAGAPMSEELLAKTLGKFIERVERRYPSWIQSLDEKRGFAIKSIPRSTDATAVSYYVESRSTEYNIWGRCAGSDEPSWANGDNPVYELLCSTNGFPGLPASPGHGYNDATNSMAWSFWMWIREGTSSASLFVDRSQCRSGPENGGWWDSSGLLGGGISEMWYETTEVVSDLCDNDENTTIGCASQKYRCLSDRRVYSSDIAVSNTNNYSVVNQNSLTDCLGDGESMDNLWLHEIGHSYTIDHENEGASIMNKTIPIARNCHVGQEFSAYPFPDDINALMNEHKGYDSTNPPKNFAGTRWYWDGSSMVAQGLQITRNSGETFSFSMPFAAHYFYPPTPSLLTYKLVFIPSSVSPTFQYSNNAWQFPSGTVYSSAAAIQWQSPPSIGFSGRVVAYHNMSANALPAGQWYRVWVWVDAFQSYSETDEGDNVFPTTFLLYRAPS